MFNPCYEHCFIKYGKQYTSECDTKCDYAVLAKEKRIFCEQLDRRIESLYDIAIQICTVTECKNCPVHYEPFETRTEFEKESQHEPCCTNLYRWILERADEI